MGDHSGLYILSSFHLGMVSAKFVIDFPCEAFSRLAALEYMVLKNH